MQARNKMLANSKITFKNKILFLTIRLQAQHFYEVTVGASEGQIYCHLRNQMIELSKQNQIFYIFILLNASGKILFS